MWRVGRNGLPVKVVRRQKETVLSVNLEESSHWPALETREMV